MAAGVYVETVIDAGMDRLWQRTQDPRQHARWDLRFGRIVPEEAAQQESAASGSTVRRFRYATTVFPGVTVSGTGVHAGEKHRPDGSRTSVLRFSSAHPLSFIAEGSGYWRYLPSPAGGIVFLTGYDYRPPWGRPGALADRLIFRPLIGWATAWSFDRLRLWLERGITPERSRFHAVAEVITRLAAIALAAFVHPLLAILVLAAAALIPPSPVTPAARRCRRHPDRSRHPGRTGPPQRDLSSAPDAAAPAGAAPGTKETAS
ncbi:hypothetical protein [Sediminivirga luteola]|uniref:Polyketide cyclase/dehydrase/lipid transport protein n=1 Tax=Sediminivirga luteola TaxID=1774748 RepID=A0A8J2XEF6_9MICO|nr:hypothetical protein [Sediminivirga luteola]GGA08057.1 hypothetical protein GCM10011333_08590 [Sediminivirga luteola]